MRRPVHPILIALPLVAFAATIFAIVGHVITRDVGWYEAALVAGIAGVAIALVAFTVDLVDAENQPAGTEAREAGMRRVGFEFLLSYHAPLEQLLSGTAWQVDTPTPDDVVYEALAGDDAKSAVPGYDPDLPAENGVASVWPSRVSRFGTSASTAPIARSSSCM